MSKLKIEDIHVPGYEKVIRAVHEASGLKCMIAIHDTTLGPALGGTRIYPYRSEEDALNDVLNLAKAMTFKSALAETGLGGGKGVIIADPETEKTPELLHAYAEVINTLKGRYIAAEDMGSTIYDVALMREKTPYVAALPTRGSSGDPSRFTARGVCLGIKAAALSVWGSDDLTGKKIAIQGLGSVGAKLARHLFWEGALLFVSDLDERQIETTCHEYSAISVPPEDLFGVECDVFSPCAFGGILTEASLPELRAAVIAGSANNQLSEESVGKSLMKSGRLYAPDFVVNAGGIINASCEFDEGGYCARKAMAMTNKIYETLLSIFKTSQKEGIPTVQVAMDLAAYKLKNKIGKRKKALPF